MQNGNASEQVAQVGLARLSVEQNGVTTNGPSDGQNGAIVPVGEARTALPAPDLGGLRSVETHTQALGVIQPPPDLKAIVDKTATFVARNGDPLIIPSLTIRRLDFTLG